MSKMFLDFVFLFLSPPKNLMEPKIILYLDSSCVLKLKMRGLLSIYWKCIAFLVSLSSISRSSVSDVIFILDLLSKLFIFSNLRVFFFFWENFYRIMWGFRLHNYHFSSLKISFWWLPFSFILPVMLVNCRIIYGR